MKVLEDRIAELRKLEADCLADAECHQARADVCRANAAAWAAHRVGIEEAMAAYAAPPKPKLGRPPKKTTNSGTMSVPEQEWENYKNLKSRAVLNAQANTPSPEQTHAPEAKAETS